MTSETIYDAIIPGVPSDVHLRFTQRTEGNTTYTLYVGEDMNDCSTGNQASHLMPMLFNAAKTLFLPRGEEPQANLLSLSLSPKRVAAAALLLSAMDCDQISNDDDSINDWFEFWSAVHEKLERAVGEINVSIVVKRED